MKIKEVIVIIRGVEIKLTRSPSLGDVLATFNSMDRLHHTHLEDISGSSERALDFSNKILSIILRHHKKSRNGALANIYEGEIDELADLIVQISE